MKFCESMRLLRYDVVTLEQVIYLDFLLHLKSTVFVPAKLTINRIAGYKVECTIALEKPKYNPSTTNKSAFVAETYPSLIH